MSVREGRIQKRHAVIAASAAAKAAKAAAKEVERAALYATMDAVLQAKVGSYSDPHRMLTIAYGNTQGKLFTEEEDRFLFCKTAELGYGNWKQLLDAVKCCMQFRFNWLFKSRTPAELSRRVDLLIRLVEKENATSRQ